MSYTIPCSTDGCTGAALDDLDVCHVCYDRNGYAEGYSRSRDRAWLDYKTIPEIRLIPIEGPGCNNHPVTPRPDFCEPCKERVGDAA